PRHRDHARRLDDFARASHIDLAVGPDRLDPVTRDRNVVILVHAYCARCRVDHVHAANQQIHHMFLRSLKKPAQAGPQPRKMTSIPVANGAPCALRSVNGALYSSSVLSPSFVSLPML